MNSPDPILTLEPLLEAVREGLEEQGWSLSGLQKTTSYEFEGRWAGDSSRSAYLFFHSDQAPDWVSVDVFLDETSRGLRGNLALVAEGPQLAHLGEPEGVLTHLAEVAKDVLPKGYRTPLTLRYRLPSLRTRAGESDTEFRFKLYIPVKAMESGHSAVSAVAASTARAFRNIIEAPELGSLFATE